jgi:hypothetical protein
MTGKNHSRSFAALRMSNLVVRAFVGSHPFRKERGMDGAPLLVVVRAVKSDVWAIRPKRNHMSSIMQLRANLILCCEAVAFDVSTAKPKIVPRLQ